MSSGTNCLGDHLSMGTKYLGTVCPGGPIFLGTICPWGPIVLGTICPWGPNEPGLFVLGDQLWGTKCPGTEWVRDQMRSSLHVNVVCECPLMMKSWSKSPIGLCIQTLINLSLPRPFCTKNVRIHISLQKLHFVQLDLIQFCSLEIFITFS